MKIKLVGVIFLCSLKGMCQGFINLNFENATIVTDPSQGSPFVYASDAIPGWTAYIGGNPQTDIAYNGFSTGGAQVNIEATNNPGSFPPIQGKYFILLQGDDVSAGISAGIGQTAQIPANAMSLTFWGSVYDPTSPPVTFDGQSLTLSDIGSTGDYTIYDADISAYAGETGQLLFTAQSGGIMFLDNIQFSPNPVPEPDALGLSAFGGLFLAWRRWKNHQR